MVPQNLNCAAPTTAALRGYKARTRLDYDAAPVCGVSAQVNRQGH